MAKENSFLNYIQNKHESEIINRCLGFLVKHKYVVENKIKRSFSSTFDYEHEDISFKNVYIDSKGNGNIEFDVIVGYSVSFEIVEGKYHDHDRDEVDDIWLTVSCSGLVGETLKNFKITHIDEFNKNKPRKPMDGELVPIIGKSQFNEIAEDILFKYYPEVLDKPSPIDPLVLAERLGLLVEKHNLSSDNSIFGQIYFKTTKTKIFDNNVEEEIEAKENTIFYDEDAAFLFSVIPYQTLILFSRDPLGEVKSLQVKYLLPSLGFCANFSLFKVMGLGYLLIKRKYKIDEKKYDEIVRAIEERKTNTVSE